MQLQVVYDYLTLQHFVFEFRLVAVLGLSIIILALFISTRVYWKRIYYKITRHPEATQIFMRGTSLRYILRDLTFIFKLLLIVELLLIVWHGFYERPEIISVSPSEYSRFDDALNEIHIEFGMPVDVGNITFHTSPEVNGEWIWENSPLQLPLYRKVKFVPEESFYPGSQVVIYMVGLRQAWFPWKSHEHALTFSAPVIPSIRSSLPPNNSIDIPTNTAVVFDFNGPIGPFIDLLYEITPDVKISEVKSENNQQTISFTSELDQDQTYRISVHRTPRSYHRVSGEDVLRGDTEKISEIAFTTVSSPLIKSFEPQGSAVLADNVIRVVFDQEMNPESVSRNFAITPATEGNITWENNLTFVFDPTQDLTKNTEYSVTFSSGIKSLAGGATEQIILYKFKSIGPVKLENNLPLSGSTGIDPATQIKIEFNQAVNHVSAQTNFSISPPIHGDFSWDEDGLIFTPNSQLAYSTYYTVSLIAGVQTVAGMNSEENYSFSFTTKNNSFTLAVPWFKQTEGFTCNIVAARMVLAYRGLQFSESTIRDTIGFGQNPDVSWVNGYGTHIGTIASMVSPYRNTAVKTNWNTLDLVKEVQNGNPVIIWEYNRYSQPPGPFTLPGGYIGYNGMHSEVVRGFIGDPNNPTHILTNDPWRGQLTYSREQFESVWSYMGNTALVIY